MIVEPSVIFVIDVYGVSLLTLINFFIYATVLERVHTNIQRKNCHDPRHEAHCVSTAITFRNVNVNCSGVGPGLEDHDMHHMMREVHRCFESYREEERGEEISWDRNIIRLLCCTLVF